MGYQLTRPDTDQVKFTSAKTGDWLLEDYLQDAELGNRTLSALLTDLFDPGTGVQKSRVIPEDVIAAAASAVAANNSAIAAALSLAGVNAILVGGFVTSFNGQTGAVTTPPPPGFLFLNAGII